MPHSPHPLRFYVDRSLYRKAYGVLANEHLMFPLDQSDWPVKTDRTRQLFVDDYLIASYENVRRRVHLAIKHPDNPLLEPDRPWEGAGCAGEHVRWDEERQRFRMWYQALTNFELPSGTRVTCPTCYAESEDGLHWTKPELGICEYEGSKANNIVILTGSIAGLFDEPADPDPGRRFKALVWHRWRDTKPMPPEGYYLFTSPDGLHWTQDRPEPSLLNQNRNQPGIGDTSTFYWDPRLRKYICDTKILFRSPTMRSRGMMESDDLIHWSRPRMTIYPDGLDAPDSQIYGHLGFVYESMWIGLLRVMRTELFADSHKQTPIELTASRDGRTWSRVGQREEFLPLGERDQWDPHYQDPHSPPIQVGDELWFYYRSMPLFAPREAPESKRKKICRIGLARLRRDGFVSLDADDQGLVVTRPLTFDGTALYVNAQVENGGYIKAELRGTTNQSVEPYVLSNCRAVTGDSTKAHVTWDGADTIDRPDGQSLRIAFEIKNARLFSFWVE